MLTLYVTWCPSVYKHLWTWIMMHVTKCKYNSSICSPYYIYSLNLKSKFSKQINALVQCSEIPCRAELGNARVFKNKPPWGGGGGFQLGTLGRHAEHVPHKRTDTGPPCCTQSNYAYWCSVNILNSEFRFGWLNSTKRRS
jgi:hypothetical protein